MLQDRDRYSRLNGVYGALLTEKQREVLNFYLDMDLSLQEISEKLGVSRQAVHDLIKRSLEQLSELENKLLFDKRLSRIKEAIMDLLEKSNFWDQERLKELEELFSV